ncbi:MAG: aminodeoxychorismate synthase component I [Candidatus Hydrogenedentota bacterium]
MENRTEFGDVRFVSRTGERLYQRPETVVTARALDEVQPAMARVQRAVAGGAHAAGFISYEAAPAFDRVLKVHPPARLPLVWIGLYNEVTHTSWQAPERPVEVGPWEHMISREAYEGAIRSIRDYIAAGDTYQVNFSFPLAAPFCGDPLAWFYQLCAAQKGDYNAYVDAGTFMVLSASPELFFHIDEGQMTVRPMKGTAPRGLYSAQDKRQAEALAHSEKNRAENLMIVDLLRNDLGRACRTGTVKTPKLFDVERYETVWQMTSTVTGRTDASVPEVLNALFPSGSVTGAPKARTMEIIRELEAYPRGVYCGSMGWWAPSGEASFNVAIRTVTVDAEREEARYHVGGGIVWDSTALGEYEECQTKTAFLSRHAPRFSLLESLRWDEAGYFLYDLHLERLRQSGDYFGIDADWAAVERRLKEEAARLTAAGTPHKVRLLVDQAGDCALESTPLHELPPLTLTVGLAVEPVDSGDVFLYHKTTKRDMYERARQQRPECDDVILWNERGELTESTMANLVCERRGILWTPPVDAGLLAGCFRQHLLDMDVIKERTLTKDDLEQADGIWLINSVRRWILVEWVSQRESGAESKCPGSGPAAQR